MTDLPLADAVEPRQVWVCQYRSCEKNNSQEVLAAFQALALPGITAIGCGCQGQCSTGPTVRILPDQTWYYRVKVTDVEAIASTHLQHNQPVQRLLHPRFHPQWS